MSKFKKGDRVRYIGPSTHIVKYGHVYTVNKFWNGNYEDGDFVRVEEVSDRHSLHSYHFELSNERQQMSDAIDLLAKYKVSLYHTYSFPVPNKVTGVVASLAGDAEIRDKEAVLDHLFPTETPAQKKLKELEQQQLELVAKMEELRNSM